MLHHYSGIETRWCNDSIDPKNTTIPKQKTDKQLCLMDRLSYLYMFYKVKDGFKTGLLASLIQLHTVSPRGVPQMRYLDIDANGIPMPYKRSQPERAKDMIEASSIEEEIKKMVRDAEEHAAEDEKIKDLADARNQADNMIYQVEKSLNEIGDKISQDEKDSIKKSIESLKSVMTTDNLDEIKAKTEEVQKASYKLAEELYKNQQTNGGQQQDQSSDFNTQNDSNKGNSKKENVEDADYEVVDDDEKN